MQSLLQESRQLFYLKTVPDGRLTEANPLVEEIIKKNAASSSLEADILSLSPEEKIQLDEVLADCLQNADKPGTIVLRNTKLVTFFKPVRWEITYVPEENAYRWIGFSLYNKKCVFVPSLLINIKKRRYCNFLEQINLFQNQRETLLNKLLYKARPCSSNEIFYAVKECFDLNKNFKSN
jgi:hypothetical protein